MDPRDGEREVEQWLDAALGQYGKVEPRTGLESRVLANLQSERNRIAPKRRRWWAVGTVAVAAAIVAAVWFGESSRERNPGSTAGISMTHREEAGGPKQPLLQPPVTHRAEVTQHGRRRLPTRESVVVEPRKMEQFPSPAPLNEQEKMLARYVQQFPYKAALMARAQTELHKQDELEMASSWPKTDETRSQQQAR